MEKNKEKSLTMQIISATWKSIFVAIIYLISEIFAGGLMLGFGAELPEFNRETEIFLLEVLASGMLITALLGPIHASMKVSMNRRIVSIFSIVFLNAAAMLIESAFFVSKSPNSDMLPGLLVQKFLAALITSYSITTLFVPKDLQRTKKSNEERSILSWIWRIGACVAGYGILSYGIDHVHYMLMAQYPSQSHPAGLTVPAAKEITAAIPIRGLFMIFSLLPFIIFMKSTLKAKMVLSGTILFVVGGIVPLTTHMSTLPLLLIAASLVELFFQNFLTGIISAWLLNIKEIPVQDQRRIKTA
jgi:hypothetical protein